MLIDKKRIRSLRGRLDRVAVGTKLLVGARLVPDQFAILAKAGFDPIVKIGDSVLPADVGPISRFNAEGTVVVHKDRPKENKVVQTKLHTWQQWHGRDKVEKSKIVDVRRDVYPRSKVPPPSLELSTTMTADGQLALVSPQLVYAGPRDKLLIHAINLIAEVLGPPVEVFTEDLGQIIKAPIRRMNWDVLPPGHRSWNVLKPDVSEIIESYKGGDKVVIERRFETVNSYGPDFVAVGRAGFSGYVVFGFKLRKLFVFESVYPDNATYIFGNDWEALSQLTKSQILENKLQLARVIHNASWFEQIALSLSSSP